MTWRIFVDTGGTFTDCIAVDGAGAVHRAKVLSSGALRCRAQADGPDTLLLEHAWTVADGGLLGYELRAGDTQRRIVAHDGTRRRVQLDAPIESFSTDATCELRTGEPAPILAARLVTGTPASEPLPATTMRLGTTLGTNALLERRGAAPVLVVTAGFADVLAIGDQQRTDIFALRVSKPATLFGPTLEVTERLAADGSIITPLTGDALSTLARDARRLLEAGARTAAVALLHAYANPAHERRVVELLREIGFDHVVSAAELAPSIGLVRRGETAVVDARLGPIVRRSLDEVSAALQRLLVMTSAGGLEDAAAYRASSSLLSGPAGGVSGARAAAARAGLRRIIAFDMGGTSTDVSRCDGEHDYAFEHRVGDARIVAPALRIETVAAGGGSICDFRDGRLHVGPQSAGADPGPACYGRGGPLTITDVNLLLGRLQPEHFEIPIDIDAAELAVAGLQRATAARGGDDADRATLLNGCLQIANERMAGAIEQISLLAGFDPRDHVLVAFGGAGGQHACSVARHLGMQRVLMPPDASLLSAVGLRASALERFAERSVLRPIADAAGELDELIDELGRSAVQSAEAAAPAGAAVGVRRVLLELRLVGQEGTIAIDHDAASDIETAFLDAYERIYRYRPAGLAVELVAVRVIASTPDDSELGVETPVSATAGGPVDHRFVHFESGAVRTPIFDRQRLSPGAEIDGPALVFDRRSSYVIEPGWSVTVGDDGGLLCTSSADVGVVESDGGVVEQALFTNRFTQMVEEAGHLLRRTAISTNIRDRLDFSCALLDGSGLLLVNAPHIPVHLGAMGLCVRAVAGAIELESGDVAITNHPGCGGSHLPDVTVITPVFASGESGPLAFVASRAHHAEIGGVRPGSMPPTSTTLADEGVVIPAMHLHRGGVDRTADLERLLRSGPWPSRNIAHNLADVRAAVAANAHAASALQRLIDGHGADVVRLHMTLLHRRAARLAGAALRRLGDGTRRGRQTLDDGATLAVSITIDSDRAVIDFDGTSGTHPGNLNATPAIVRSAVMYALRLLIGERLPLNEGILDVVELRIPPGMLAPDFTGAPADMPAVACGNTETSQRLVDTLLQALGLCACSQGTMNNLLFGDASGAYYETICGGSGAGPDFDGIDAVHTHMTNTRLTDVEVLERRYPVRVHRFAVRRGSGGGGRHRGGDGVVREIEFLSPMEVSLLAQHRSEGPYGVDGGEPGKPGEQRIVRADGGVEALGGNAGFTAAAGDRLVIETPGGGGFGRA